MKWCVFTALVRRMYDDEYRQFSWIGQQNRSTDIFEQIHLVAIETRPISWSRRPVFVHDFQPFHPRFTRVVLKIWIIHGEHQCVHYSVIKMDSTSFFGMFIATRQIHRIKIDFEDTNKGTTTINKEINDWQRDWRENAFVLINRGSLLTCFFLSCNAICGLILGFLTFTSFKLYR